MSWSSALLLAVVQNARMVLAKAARTVRPETVTGKTIPSGGLMIALLGSDGAGKSTVGRELHRWLRFKLDVHGYYMGSGDGGNRPTDLVRRGIRSIVKAAKGNAVKKPKVETSTVAATPPGFFRKLAELYQLVIMRHKVKQLRAARRLVSGGSIALVDRYPQTQFTGISDGPKIQNGGSFAWAAQRELVLYAEAATLGPDIAVKLKVTPAVAHARKPDHDIAIMARKARIVDELAFPQARMVEIDATQPLADVVLSAKRAIWANLVVRR